MLVSMARAPALLPPPRAPALLPWTLGLLMPVMVSMASAVTVTGWVGQPVTLPCRYTARTAREVNPVCWGRGACPYSQCSDPLIQTDQTRVTWAKSNRYQLQGQLTRGDVSLTILDANEGDRGTYCCRIDVPGWFNDLKYNIELQMMKATTTTVRTTTTTTPEPTTTSAITTEATTTFEPTTTSQTTTSPLTTTAAQTPIAAHTTMDATTITRVPTTTYVPTTIPTTATTKTTKATTEPSTTIITTSVSTTTAAQTLPTVIPTTSPATTMITTPTNTEKATPATTFITIYTTETIPNTTPPIVHSSEPTTTPTLSHTNAPRHEPKITNFTTAESTLTTIANTLTVDQITITAPPSSGTSSPPAIPYTTAHITTATTTPIKPPITTNILVHTTATVTISTPATNAVASTTPIDASTNASISTNNIPTTVLGRTSNATRTVPAFTFTNTPAAPISISATIALMTPKYKTTSRITDAIAPTRSRTPTSFRMDSTGHFSTTGRISTLKPVNTERQPAHTGQHTVLTRTPAAITEEIPVSKSDVSLSGNEIKREGKPLLSSASLIAVVCGSVAFCVLILLLGLRVKSKLWNKYHLDKSERLWADGRPVELFNRTLKDGDEPDNIFSL